MPFYEVKVFDAKGKLIRTIQPGFDSQPTGKWVRKFEQHDCPECGEKTTKKMYCYQCVLKRQAVQNGMKGV